MRRNPLPEGKGTRLFLEHAGFDPDHPLQQKARAIMEAGWRSHVMRRIDEVLRSWSRRRTSGAESRRVCLLVHPLSQLPGANWR
ncbi:hypothetical protein OG563_44140 [Nocardia vinacea]|uniref:Uncharacterized protein n=1 Tax=Nocardia vinacea TaxID=96468 RepID=A0ABZ1YSK6_9NOCA|nr:hypothetical protein [Nocardia vinacea]